MILAIDTETDKWKRPFLASTCDADLKTNLYTFNKENDFINLKQHCENPNINKIFHNAVFDIYALSQVGVNVVPPYNDTMIMSSLLNENYSPKKLKYLAKVFLKESCNEAGKLRQIVNKYKIKYGIDFGYDKIPAEIIRPYAAKDAEYTIKLYFLFKRPIEEFRDLYDIELKLIPPIVKMIQRGILVDRSFCQSEIKNLDSLYRHYSGKLFRKTGKIFSINSPNILRSVLKEQNILIHEYTKKGKISTTKDTLKNIKNDAVKFILKMRSIDKQIDTYYMPLLYNYTTGVNPVAHFTFYQSGAKTGRFSADLIQTIPNSTTVVKDAVPNRIRGAFIVRPGFTNIHLDYDQIEMRLFAHFSKDKKLINAICNNVDVHYDTACNLFSQEVVETNKKYYRTLAKGINFGIIYGMGQQSLSKQLDLSLFKANEILSSYYKQYRVKQFISETTSELYKKGYINLQFGKIERKYRIPKQLAYKGVNALIQGAAAYIIKLAMLRINDYLVNYTTNQVNMLLTLHDEILIEISHSLDSNKIMRKIKNLMEDSETFSVPITCSVSYSNTSWINKKEILL